MSKSAVKFLSLILICVGLILTFTALMPIIQYELLVSPTLERREFLSPVSNTTPKPSGPRDYTKASTWFDGYPLPSVNYQIKHYKLSIPKLKIKDAVVEVGGEDLTKSLIHFGGTALPGKPGNAVIFGHSTILQLYNPNNYMTIFSYLPTLKKGEDLFVEYDGITYTFKVEEMFEVKPDALQILEQKDDNSYITLVTCVPPGTYLRRLIVRAKIVPYKR
ncbi:MAG: sortase [Patescibacteria group bacterium]